MVTSAIILILIGIVIILNDSRKAEKKHSDFWRQEYISEHEKYNNLLNSKNHEG